jgi:hypothetical protein
MRLLVCGAEDTVSRAAISDRKSRYDIIAVGYIPVGAARAGLASTKAAEGALNGQVIAVD